VGTRREAREHALQLLYGVDLSKEESEKALRVFWAEEPADDDIVSYATDVVRGVVKDVERIDGLITEASTNWKIGRMAYVDRNILRLAIFEFLHRDDVPTNVSINEAIELGKRFGTTESGAFINGILDRIARTQGLTNKT